MKTPDTNEPLRSGRWFGSPERKELVDAMLATPRWKRRMMMLLSPRKTKLARAYNMVAADGLNRDESALFEHALQRGDQIWAEILWPNNETSQPRGQTHE